MNSIRYAAAARASSGGGRGGRDAEISQGANSVSPVKLIANHQWRTLAPYLRPTSRATVIGQGSSQDYLSVTSYACDYPTGDNLAVITPIYTPQQYDDYFLPIDGSTVPFGAAAQQTDVQNLDISPGNTAAIGVVGKSGRRLPFVNQIVPGKGIKPTPYGLYDYKVPPSDSIYTGSPPQGKNAPGTIAPKPGAKDRVVNRPLITVYLSDGLTWETEDKDGFTPMKVKIGRGLAFGAPDTNDENRRPLDVTLGGGSAASIEPGPGIVIDPPSPPPIASANVQAVPGAMSDGDYEYAAAYVTADAESGFGEPASISTSAGNEQVQIVFNPLPVPPANVSGLRLYRTKVNGTDYFRVTTFTTADLIAGITYVDNASDASLLTAYAGGSPAIITVDLATDARGRNISGLVENAGVDTNGLSMDPYGPYTLVAGPGIAILPPAPPYAPDVALGASGGSVDVGSHDWAVSYTLTDGTTIIETNPSTRTSLTIAVPHQQVDVTADAPPAGNVGGFTARSSKLWRSKIGDPTLYLVTESMGGGALSYTDAVADSGLGAAIGAPQKSQILVDLARDGGGANISNLVENVGTDSNGLKASGGFGGVAAQVHGSGAYGVGNFQLFTDADEDPGSMWDGATRLTIPETGLYYVYANSIWTSVGATGSDPIFWELDVSIGKNGPPGGPAASGVATGRMEGSWPIGDLGYGVGNEFQCMAIGMASLVAGDYIRMYVSHSDNAPTEISPLYDVMGIFKIG